MATPQPQKFGSLAEAMTCARALVAASVVQLGASFVVYASVEQLDTDAEAWRGRIHCIERVDPMRARLPFADIDHVGSLEAVAPIIDTFEKVFGARPTPIKTGGGFHLVALSAAPISHDDHIAGLQELGAAHANVDTGAYHSLRLCGTKKPHSPAKDWPIGMPMSALLVQPLGCDIVGEPRPNPVTEVGSDLPPDYLRAASIALSGAPDTFRARPISATGWVVLDRVGPSACLVCGRDHESDGATTHQIADGVGLALCFRSKKTTVFRYAPSALAASGPGEIDSVSAEGYKNPNGCNACAGDYLDASGCGLGKTVAAFGSIGVGETVLALSYRKTYTAKTAVDYGLDPLKPKQLCTLRQGGGQRIIAQVDSIGRIEIEPGALDTLVIDELHGLMRQVYSAGKSSDVLVARLVSMIVLAGRVIVLDANANDIDFAALKQLRPGMRFTKNACQRAGPSRKIIEHSGPKPTYAEMLSELARGGRVVVFAARKSKGAWSVESIAHDLRARGYIVKAYHADTCQNAREADFSNPQAAFAGVHAVIYNATVEAGLSIALPEFTRGFIYPHPVGSVEVPFQAMQRFRCISQIDVARVTSAAGRLPQTIAGLTSALDASRTASKIAAPIGGGPTGDPIGSFGWQMWAAVVLDANRSVAHYSARLAHLFISAGWAATASKSGGPCPELVQQPENETLEARIACASILTPEETDALKTSPTPKSAAELEALALSEYAQEMNIDPDTASAAGVAQYGGRGQALRAYLHLLKNGAPIPIGAGIRSQLCPPDEVLRIASDLSDALGFGRISTPTRLKSVASTVMDKTDLNAIRGQLTQCKQIGWGRLCPGMSVPTGIRTPGTATIRAGRTALESLVSCHYGMTIESNNKQNPSRGSYAIVPAAWPMFADANACTFAAHRDHLKTSGHAPGLSTNLDLDAALGY